MTGECSETCLSHLACTEVRQLTDDARGSPLLSHLYVNHNDLFSALVFVAVGFAFGGGPVDVDMMNAMAKQALGYSTSEYIWFFVSDEGASLVEKNDKAFDSLIYAKDPETWKWHLGAKDGLAKFIESGEVLPIADYISQDEVAMHNRILKNGYNGVFNMYKAAVRCQVPENKDLTPEDKKIKVPTLLILASKDYVVMKEAQEHVTKSAAADIQVITLDTAHWVMLEDRDGFEKLLEDFAAAKGTKL